MSISREERGRITGRKRRAEVWAKIEAGTWSTENRDTLRAYLREHRGEKCEECGNVEWRGQPIPLEIDHIDGNWKDNRLSNLRLLCPNCHSLTPTYKNKNRGNGRTSRRVGVDGNTRPL